MLRLQHQLHLNPDERAEFHRTTGRFIRHGQPIPVADYNQALETAAVEAFNLDPQGYGILDADLIRALKIVGEHDATSDHDLVVHRVALRDDPF
jgi:hypothetical protein